ncbi:MAG: nicotinate-nicotinamide nucleotide adenylyltransferase [Proteobacteria bacterium]|nr:nicotinate-nicotinamide nucleotide adenylyltransferase [Cystobacterineae bacterium]MCL2259315.1 nicotinate-nicotinamide nucleotide adenylyltransferase [Cystobacterineae bacterium]MCL2314264.1 nicotinate-nicotinamide nucleotide adenylyltransferase [Pseudomonadota bacterium]
MNVALLGGSFNPPHMGHALGASFARMALGVDELWLLPAFRHPLGKVLLAFEHRLEMCRLLAGQLGPWAKAVDMEAHIGGEGRTVDLLEHLLPLYPGWHFQWLMGSDTVADLPLWKGFSRIQELVKIVVIHRLGYPLEQAIGPGLAALSSTEVRHRIERQDIPEGWLPTTIADYVRTHRLYLPYKP